MFTFFHSIRLWLEANGGVAAPWLLLTVLIFAAVNGIKKFVPGLWTWFDRITPSDGMLEHVIMGLPSVLLGAIATWMLTGGELGEIWKGALTAALAPLLHLWAKNYQGAPAKAPPSGAGTVTLVILVGLSSIGCAGSFEESRLAAHPRLSLAPPSERCVSLDSQHRTWGAVEKGSAFLAGGAGIVMIPVDDGTGRIVLASSAAAMGALAVTAAFVSQDAATTWAAECSVR